MSALMAFGISLVALACGGLVALVVYLICRFCNFERLQNQFVVHDQPNQNNQTGQTGRSSLVGLVGQTGQTGPTGPTGQTNQSHVAFLAETVGTSEPGPTITIRRPTIDAIVVGNDPLNIHRIVTLAASPTSP
jgi:hypothetical protein